MVTEPRLEHQTIKIRQLIDDYRGGRIVIPEFQREYVWRRGKAPRLIDSLYNGFPISSLLLWQSTELARARRKNPRPARGVPMSWLIDGQQRVITLARVMTGDEGIDVVFDPDEEAFLLANAATRRDPAWYRVADLWDDECFRILRRNLDGGHMDDKRKARFEKVRRILDYEVPFVRMVDHSFQDAVTAFTRINTLGVRLKQEDIESAHVAARHSGFVADHVTPFVAKIRQSGFSRLNVMHLFRACAFVSKPDGRIRTPLHELPRKDVLAAWAKTERAAQEAINIVRSEFGLVNMNVLWSGALLVPVIALCASLEPRERDSRALAGWMALAAIVRRYSGSSETALDQDLKACRATDPVGSLLSNLRQVRPALEAKTSDFAGSLLDRSGLFAMYVACTNRGILDFYTGGKILLHPAINRHHILPRAQFRASIRSKADTVANIAFIGGDINKAIAHSGPEVYLKTLSKKVLASQCIPMEENLWRVDQSHEFWEARRALLAESFNEFVRNSLPGRKLS